MYRGLSFRAGAPPPSRGGLGTVGYPGFRGPKQRDLSLGSSKLPKRFVASHVN